MLSYFISKGYFWPKGFKCPQGHPAIGCLVTISKPVCKENILSQGRDFAVCGEFMDLFCFSISP